MIGLKRKSEYQIEVCEAVLRRAFLSEEEKFFVELEKQCILGDASKEEREQFIWDGFLYIDGGVSLLYDLELQDRFGYRFTFETVLISPRFILVVTPKYINGDFIFSESKRRFYHVNDEGPIEVGQLYSDLPRKSQYLEMLLMDLGVWNLPVLYAVLITSPYAFVEYAPEPFNILDAERLRGRFREWFARFPKVLNDEQLVFIQEKLLKRHRRFWRPTAIENLKLRKGIFCECGERMIYHSGTCRCICGRASMDGILEGLEDYRLLVDEWMTKQQMYEFFELLSVEQAGRILKKLQLKSDGARRNAHYHIPVDILAHPLGSRFRWIPESRVFTWDEEWV